MAKRPGSPDSGLTRRQTSKARREALIQRWVIIGSVVTAVAVVSVIAYAFVNQSILTPARAVATVNGQVVTVKQFQDRVKVDLYFATLNPYGGNTDPRAVAQQSLDNLIAEVLLRDKAKQMGVTASDDEVQRRAQLAFGYDGGTPEPTSTPFPTLPPTVLTTPTATSTFVLTPTPTATETPIPGVTLTPSATPTTPPTATATPGDLTATALFGVTPTATLTLTPAPTSTPLSATDYAKSSGDFLTNGATLTGLTADQVRAIWYDKIRALILREKMITKLDIKADDTREMVHAAHILVETQDAANKILDRIAKGEQFEKLAAELSRDTGNAYKGGDLDWFSRTDVVTAFADVAFSTPPGQISKPVQTQFGWHVIKVYQKTAVPLTASEKDSQIQTKFDDQVKKWRDEAKVTTDDNWVQYIPQLNNPQSP